MLASTPAASLAPGIPKTNKGQRRPRGNHGILNALLLTKSSRTPKARVGLSEVPGEARSGHQNWDAMPTRKPAAPSRALLTQIPTARERSCEQRPSPSPSPRPRPQDGTAIETAPTSSSRRPPWAESHAQAPPRGQGYASIALHQIKRGKSPRERRTSRQIAMSRAVLCCAVWNGSVGGHRGGAGNGVSSGRRRRTHGDTLTSQGAEKKCTSGWIRLGRVWSYKHTRAPASRPKRGILGASPMAIDALPCLSLFFKPSFCGRCAAGEKKRIHSTAAPSSLLHHFCSALLSSFFLLCMRRDCGCLKEVRIQLSSQRANQCLSFRVKSIL